MADALDHTLDLRYAIAIARFLPRAVGRSDEVLASDPFVRWVAALFDERAKRAIEPWVVAASEELEHPAPVEGEWRCEVALYGLRCVRRKGHAGRHVTELFVGKSDPPPAPAPVDRGGYTCDGCGATFVHPGPEDDCESIDGICEHLYRAGWRASPDMVKHGAVFRHEWYCAGCVGPVPGSGQLKKREDAT